MTDQIKDKLDKLFQKYNRAEFIENDPISVPHLFTGEQDIEIAAFLSSTIAWGQRKSILKSAKNMVERMDMRPYDFVQNATADDIKRASRGFVYRTFNEVDFEYFLTSLADIYKNGSLRSLCEQSYAQSGDIRTVLDVFYSRFFATPALPRTTRHLSNINRGSACKRLNMLLRWLVRVDGNGVDFGLWRGIDPCSLYIPLDVHASRQGRALGLLGRKQNDWKAVEELTAELKLADPTDPAKYDFALFGLGVSGDIA